MYQNCCKKCGSISLHIENKGNNVGLYCNDCGAWIKWLGKDELRAFNYKNQSKNSQNISHSSADNDYRKKYFDIVDNLKDFIGFLDNSVNTEMCILPLGDIDAVRKSSYCLALERCEKSIFNILKGKPFDFVE